MTRCFLAGLLPVLVPLLAACSQQTDDGTATTRLQSFASGEQPSEVTADGQDPDAAARLAGYASAAQQARARHYWSEESRAAVPPPAAEGSDAQPQELARR